MLLSSRLALVALWVMFFVGSFLFLANQNPELVQGIEEWLEGGGVAVYESSESYSDDNDNDDGENADDVDPDDDEDEDNDDNDDNEQEEDENDDDDFMDNESENSNDNAPSPSGHKGSAVAAVAVRGSINHAKAATTTFENQAHFQQGRHGDDGLSIAKYPFMPKVAMVDDENRICFVNVGKTAGSSVACSLGFAYDQCPIDRVRIPNGNLPQYTTSMIHKDVNGCRSSNGNGGDGNSSVSVSNNDPAFGMFLFVVRDPLERIKTWFAYERPKEATYASSVSAETTSQEFDRKKLLFTDCPFATLDDLGGSLGLGGNNVTVCSQRAWNAILGVEAYAEHNYYNYAYYLRQVMEMKHNNNLENGKLPRLAILRTEHLEQDWRTIETQLLNGPDPFRTNFSFPTRHSPYRRPEDSILSPASQGNICRALCAEIQIYKQLLEQAENLNADDYVASIRELQEHCPNEALRNQCS